MADLIVVNVVLVILLCVQLSRVLRPAKVSAGVERWASRSGLAAAGEVRAFLMRRRRATWIGHALGVAVGLELGSIVLLGTEWSLTRSYAFQAVGMLLGGFGALVGGWVASILTPAPGRRVAHERAVTIADYVDPRDHRLVPVAAAAAALAGILPTVLGASTLAASQALLSGSVGLLAAVSAEIFARAVVTRPQRAGSLTMLAWTDALKAETARSVLFAGAALAAATVASTGPATVRLLAPDAAPETVTSWAAVAVSASIVVLVIRTAGRRSERYFLRRLWPGTADQVAMAQPASPPEAAR